MKEDYTREELIDICEKSIVPEFHWSNRDSHEAHLNIGSCWALLKAGCDFRVLTSGILSTDDRTIWLEIDAKGFTCFEGGAKQSELYYLPTIERLSKGGDWY